MTATCDVAVIGCGLMGSALARALAASGYRVTVWNRTPERARALAGERIRVAATPSEAVDRTGLVIACTSTYDTTREALSEVAQWSDTLVSLCTGTPEDARAMARWAAQRGAAYLDGSILAFPDFIGSPDAILAYAGDHQAWQRHESTLMCLGGASRYLAEAAGAAKALESAVIGMFYVVSISAYVDAVAYAHAEGLPPDMLRDATRLVLRTLGHSTKEAAAAVASGAYATDQATLATYAEGARATLDAMRHSGQHGRLLEAALGNLDRARASGLGHLGIYAQALVSAVDPS